MSELYQRIEMLCKANGVTITQMCRESGVSRGGLSDLKAGRTKFLSSETMNRIAEYFHVTVDFLLGKEIQTKKDPAEDSGVTDEDIKFALFGGGDVTDEQFEEVKQFARFVRERDAAKAAQQKN